MNFKLLTYNIHHGGHGREAPILHVLQQAQADVVILQEAKRKQTVQDFARSLNMEFFSDHGIALLTKYPIVATHSYHSFPQIHDTVLEITLASPSGGVLHLFGVHPIHYPGSGLELWRNWQLRSLRKYAAQYTTEPCLIAGDFNAIAPQDRILTDGAPFMIRLMYRLQGGKIYRSAIRNILQAGFIDCYRYLHPHDDGFTIPTVSPKVRLDYIFANSVLRPLLRHCEVITEPSDVHHASDHYPVSAEFELVV